MIEIIRNPSPSELRWFAGLWWPLGCVIVGGLLHRAEHTQPALAIWLTGGAIALLGMLFPRLIKPLFVGLSYLTFPIGLAVSYVLVTVIYFLLITPLGLVMRLFGYDPLRLKLDRSTKSYWTPRSKVASVKQYLKQY